MQNNMSRIVSFIVLLAFIVVIGALFYRVMIGFLIPVFLAAVLVVVFRPLHRWISSRSGERDYLAAALTTAIILFLVLLPAVIVATTAAVQGASLIKDFRAINIDVTLSRVRAYAKLEMPHRKEIHSIQIEVEDLQEEVADNDTTKIYDKTQRFGSLVKRIQKETQSLKDAVNSDSHEDPKSARNSSFAHEEFEAFESILNALDPDGFSKIDSEKPDIIEVQTHAVQLGYRWQELKSKLLGGSTQALLRDLANPTERTMKTLRSGITDYIRPRLVELTSMTGGVVLRLIIGCAILTLSLFFFLYDGPAMIRGIMQLSPLDDRYEQELLFEFDRTARAVVLATILSAVVQGLIAGMGYYVVGMPSLILLILLTSTCALIPFVGPALVWVPVCLYLLIYQENTFAAAGLALWGMLVVGTSDNFVKALVLHGQRQLHPLLALLSVLGGVQALGPIGILVGPMAVTMLQTLLGILQNELTMFDSRSKESSTTPPGDRLRKRMGKRAGRQKDESKSSQSGDVLATDLPADGPPSD